jgi:hypothetical protein
MDAHAGHVTRDHSDIELFVWEAEAPAVRRTLAAAGFTWVPSLHPDEGEPFLKDGQEISVTFLVRPEDGRVFTPRRWSDWPWVDGAFDGPRAQLGEIEVPVTSLEGLIDMKMNFEKHPHGKPRRPKDDADIALLRRLLERTA